MTPEELDMARVDEAQRIFWAGNGAGKGPAIIAARLAREGWTPPPPVDSAVLAVREIVALEWQQFGSRTVANETRSGDHDDKWFVICALNAYKAGKEAEAERAKVLLAALDDIRQNAPRLASAQASVAIKAYRAKEADQ